MIRFAALTAVAAITSVANADIVLTVDISNPSAAVISSTGGVSSITTGATGQQISMLDMLSETWSGSYNAMYWQSGSITTWSGRWYSHVATISGSDALNFRGLPVYQAFEAGQQAFFGSITIDLSSVPIAARGTIGDVVVTESPSIVIGQYRIVPAPGAAAVLGLAGLVATRRRR